MMDIKTSNRQGISSIVGSLFFLILMFAVFGAILTAFQYQTDLVVSNRAISDAQASKILEQFSIRPIFSGSGPCTIDRVYVDNGGTNTVEIISMWVIEADGDIKTDSGNGPESISSPNSFVPPGASGEFLTSGTVSVSAGTNTVKAISALGNMRSATFTCPKQLGPEDEETIIDKLIAKPNVYAAFPNPLSQSVDGYIALILANPTGHNMYVNRTSMQVISPLNPGFFPTNNFVLDADFNNPNLDAEWGNDDYTLHWEGSPKTIAPYSAYEFRVKVNTAAALNKDATIITVNTNSLSSFGQFGSSKIDTTSIYDGKSFSVPNIFLSPDEFNGKAYYFVPGKAPNKPTTFNFTINNTGPFGTKILMNSILVINFPKHFLKDDIKPVTDNKCKVVDANSVESPGTVLVMPDKSTQVRFKIKVDIAGVADQSPNPPPPYEFVTCKIDATTPTPTSPKLYILYVYATGLVTDKSSPTPDKKPMGPVAETVVQVCHTTPNPTTPPTCPIPQ